MTEGFFYVKVRASDRKYRFSEDFPIAKREMGLYRSLPPLEESDEIREQLRKVVADVGSALHSAAKDFTDPSGATLDKNCVFGASMLAYFLRHNNLHDLGPVKASTTSFLYLGVNPRVHGINAASALDAQRIALEVAGFPPEKRTFIGIKSVVPYELGDYYEQQLRHQVHEAVFVPWKSDGSWRKGFDYADVTYHQFERDGFTGLGVVEKVNAEVLKERLLLAPVRKSDQTALRWRDFHIPTGEEPNQGLSWWKNNYSEPIAKMKENLGIS